MTTVLNLHRLALRLLLCVSAFQERAYACLREAVRPLPALAVDRSSVPVRARRRRDCGVYPVTLQASRVPITRGSGLRGSDSLAGLSLASHSVQFRRSSAVIVGSVPRAASSSFLVASSMMFASAVRCSQFAPLRPVAARMGASKPHREKMRLHSAFQIPLFGLKTIENIGRSEAEEKAEQRLPPFRFSCSVFNARAAPPL